MNFEDFNSWVDELHKEAKTLIESGRTIVTSKSPVIKTLEGFELSGCKYLHEINNNKLQQNNATIISLMKYMGQDVAHETISKSEIYEKDMLTALNLIRTVNEKINDFKQEYIEALGLKSKKNASDYFNKEFLLVR